MAHVMTILEARGELEAEIGRFEDRDFDDCTHDGHIDWLHACQRDDGAFSAWCKVRSITIVTYK